MCTFKQYIIIYHAIHIFRLQNIKWLIRENARHGKIRLTRENLLMLPSYFRLARYHLILKEIGTECSFNCSQSLGSLINHLKTFSKIWVLCEKWQRDWFEKKNIYWVYFWRFGREHCFVKIQKFIRIKGLFLGSIIRLACRIRAKLKAALRDSQCSKNFGCCFRFKYIFRGNV